jgi:hypothetical protein
LAAFVTRVSFSGSLTTQATVEVELARTTGAVSSASGTATLNVVKHDTTSGSGTAVATSYTTSTVGAGATILRAAKSVASIAGSLTPVIWDFGTRPAQAIVLRGTSEYLQLYVAAGSFTGAVFDFDVEWTEE